MHQHVIDVIKETPTTVIYTLFAFVGGFARYLHEYVTTGTFSWRFLFAKVSIAGFSGVCFFLTGESLGLPDILVGLMAGVGGFMGVDAIFLVVGYITKKVK